MEQLCLCCTEVFVKILVNCVLQAILYDKIISVNILFMQDVPLTLASGKMYEFS